MIRAALVLLGMLLLTPFTLFSPAIGRTNGNVASASGGGHAGTLTLSFGAFDHGDGNITGQATFIDDSNRTKVTVNIECLSVAGSQADVGGTVSKSSNPSFTVGSPVHFIVNDQGEGLGIVDAFSELLNGPCGSGTPNILNASDRGNIQVRFVAPDKDCTKCPAGTHCAGNGECVGGGGGGHVQCPAGTRECCGTCISEFEACPVVCP